MLQATAGFVNCTGGNNGDNPTQVSRADIDGVIHTLVTNNARRITDAIEGKVLALFKSSLIDLETRQGDKAQAEAEMLLAA